MKIHIITIHHIHNFGSVFQAFCLQRFLSNKGYDVEIIDYRPNYYQKGRNTIKSYLGRVLNLKSYLARKRKYDLFIKKNDYLSKKKYKSFDALIKEYHDSEDIFIAGGDQIWNSFYPCGRDDAYKLLFVDHGTKIACGTSMGRDDYSKEELKKISDQVAQFKAIMLREETTVKQLIEYLNIPCFSVIDPVGLIEPQELSSFAVKPLYSKKYAIMYLTDSCNLLDLAIEKLSKEYGLDIIHICGFRKKCYCDVFEKDTGPEELLGYIIESEFVISSSFHATLFSIIFNKQFAVILPEKGTNARIENLLRLFNLENRIISSTESIKNMDSVIDFSSVNTILKQYRNISIEKIDAVLRKLQ